MISMGIDIGTRFIKVCLVEGDAIIGSACREVSRRIDKALKTVVGESLTNAGIKKRHIQTSVSTGFGAHLARDVYYTLDEAPCVARAAFQLLPEVRTVVDIGGLFINVAYLDDNGKFGHSIVTERCAAGSGKFLEVIAEAIGVPLSMVSVQALRSTDPYVLSSGCAVFAESEVISQVNTGRNSDDILAGIINSLASKATTQITRGGVKEKLTLVGGVAVVSALKLALQEQLGYAIEEYPGDPQLAAAYGAALLAQDQNGRRARVRAFPGL
ncbi:MAG: acyl-CoA dehydratase activase [Ignavibacteriales bacterium]